MNTICTQEPGSEIFLPTRYTLRILNAENKDDVVLFFQSSSPFPTILKGDRLNTVSWPLGQEGYPAEVELVSQNIWSIKDQVYCETSVYCLFHSTPRSGDLALKMRSE